ncbi:UNVERIFIED_CONTAM: hypothetical protein FKN15_021463 [Acipenser sinensis]
MVVGPSSLAGTAGSRPVAGGTQSAASLSSGGSQPAAVAALPQAAAALSRAEAYSASEPGINGVDLCRKFPQIFCADFHILLSSDTSVTTACRGFSGKKGDTTKDFFGAWYRIFL